MPLIPILLVWFFAVAAPGPDFVITVKYSLVSRRTGICTAIGLGCGIMVHVAYCLLGLAFVISRSILLFNALKLVAGGYLAYLGWKSLISKNEEMYFEKTKETVSPAKAIRIGFLSNVLNPKATVFFLGLFTLGIQPDTPLSHQVYLGLFMAFGHMIWFSLLALFFSHHYVRDFFRKFSKAMNRIFGTLLIALGMKIAFSRDS